MKTQQQRSIELLRAIYDATTKKAMVEQPNRLRLVRRRIFNLLQKADTNENISG